MGGLEIAAWRGAPQPGLIAWLRWPLVAAAVASAGYSGYLFAQAKGRDYWQNPLLPAHLVVQAAIAGLAAVSILAILGGGTGGGGSLAGALAIALLVHLLLVFGGEVTVAHASRDGYLAGRALLRGSLRGWFWSSAILAVVPMVLLQTGVGGHLLIATMALLAVALYEHAWLLAGQAPPLS